MAATGEQIRSITGSSLDNTALQPFIDASGCMMDLIAECTTEISDMCLDLAQAYLASHLLTSSPIGQASKTVSKESLRGKYSVEYLVQENMGSGVLSTTFGQTANAMVNGCLAELDKRPVNLFSIGSI